MAVTTLPLAPPSDPGDHFWEAMVQDRRECAAPKATHACDGIQDFLAKHPGSAYAEAARTMLQEARPTLDELDWKEAGEAGCKAPRHSTDCDGLKNYLANFPDGKHAAEAKVLLEKNEAKLKDLAWKELEARQARQGTAADLPTVPGSSGWRRRRRWR